MEKNSGSVLGKNQFMKKTIFIATAIVIGSATFAQQKKLKQPPPPPPPKVNLDKFVPPPPPPPKVEIERFPSPGNNDYQAFLKRNPTVKGIGWMENNRVRIRLKSGKEEVYNMNNENEALKLKDKYGALPTPPPPPPAPPPPRVKKISRA